jgi:hypothetical protein
MGAIGGPRRVRTTALRHAAVAIDSCGTRVYGFHSAKGDYGANC